LEWRRSPSFKKESAVTNDGLSGHSAVGGISGSGRQRKERTEMDESSLLDVRGAAALLGISAGTLYHWLSERRVPVVRLGLRCVRFRRSDLEAWISEKSVGTNGAQVPATRRTDGPMDRTHTPNRHTEK
jgi:excisionase family DNA binding protein